MRSTGTQDLIQGVKLWGIYSYLGYDDIKQRYKRTLLGPLWLVLSNVLLVVFMSIVMSSIFKQNIKDFMPFVATGMITWSFVSTVIAESCSVFIGAESIIKFINMPISISVYRFLVRNFIIMVHNLVILFVIVLLLKQNSITLNILYLLPGIILMIAMSFSVGIIIGLLNTRYRDMQPIVTILMTLLPFVTPIFWKKDFLTHNQWIANFNPLYHVIEIIRAPLLGYEPNFVSLGIVFILAVLLSIVSIALYNKYHSRVIFWI